MKHIILNLLLCSVVCAAPVSPQWKIIKTRYATPDTVVAGYNVLDFGAKGDGQLDCTEAFQQALDQMKAVGGGTVFVPEGLYVIKGTLRVPVSVTLRGEWAAPTQANPGIRGTILMVYAGRGQAEGTPFMTVDYCAGVKDMSFWYPEQTEQDITPYPYCLTQKGGNNATFENLTLVNPYQGIRIGPGANELHYVHNVYGTPLKVGIRYDSTTDIGRLENVHFSPDLWCLSGLANTPASNSLTSWLLDNGTAIHMERSDWEYVSYVFIDGYKTGYLMTKGARGSANAQFYGLIIRNCRTAVEVQETNPYGMVFTKCTFKGRDYGFRMGTAFNAAILLNDCDVSADQALYSEGTGCFITQNSRVTRGHIALTGGTLAMTASRIENAGTQISLGPDVRGASLVGNTFAQTPPRITGDMPSERLKLIDQPVTLAAFPEYDGNQTRATRPAREVLYVVTDAPWNANGQDDQDDTQALQKAMDQAGQDGGGIVFLPGGNYVLRSTLSVPSGVELRGIHDVPHHTMGSGSLLHVTPKPDQGPTITVNARAGLRGLSFNYPDQSMQAVKDTPFLIQGRGADLYIVHVNCRNPFRFLDLMTYACDRHYVDYLSGSPLKVGVAIGGGSTQGEVRNTQFNPHYWLRLDRDNPFFPRRQDNFQALWTYQKENLDAMVVGHCNEELLFQNFVYGSLYGIHFTQQAGRGPEDCFVHGHGTDGSKVGVFFEQGNGRIDMINSELVAMSSQDKIAIKLGTDYQGTARLINTMVWGDPSTLAQVDNGQLWLQGLHAFRHGNGLQINRGEVTAVNVNFFVPGRHITLADTHTKATLIGNITKGPLMINGKSMAQDSEISNVVSIGNVSR
ncbi:MAG: glycoside hydrolase family 55 protein [Phycisphaerae bacterium]|nr:glycoside hydrolase family 55 protein [Phycisphaerae bacterium]